jgi:putative oxidoreductase
MLTHGIPKVQQLIGTDKIEFVNFLGIGSPLSLTGRFAECICSVLVIFGLVTLLAVILLIITMLIACFVVHAADPYAVKEASLLYFFLYFVILILGSADFLSISFFQGKKWFINQTIGLRNPG